MRKTIIITILILLALGFQNNVEAQISTNRNALTFKFLATDYATPIVGEFDTENFTYGGEFKYSRFLNPSFNLDIPFRIGDASYPLSDSTTLGSTSGSVDLNIVYKLNNGYLIPEEGFFAPYIFAGVGANYLNDLDDEKLDAQVPLGIGINFKLAKNIRLQVQSEYRFAAIKDYNNLRHTAGLSFLFGGGDAIENVIMETDMDGDGVTDMDDDCPEIAGTEQFRGCPDSDGDDVPDSDDDCPNERGTLRGCPDVDKDGIADKDDKCPERRGVAANNGCPEVPKDSDRDGILDKDDKCPKERGLTRFDGCPDNDGDGTPDIDDDCPTVIGSKALNGCPDTDKDGITDAEDRCPTTPGTKALNGCPENPSDNVIIVDSPPVISTPTTPIPSTTIITPSTTVITSPAPITTTPSSVISSEIREILDFAMRDVKFETGSSSLKVASYGVLEKIAVIMLERPEYGMSIEGHTDSLGDDARNQKLSEARAKACFDYLVKKGVEEGRMSYIGLGETQPIGDNKRTKGREKNRRVEFKIYLR